MSKLKTPKVKADRPKRKVTKVVESEGGLGGIALGLIIGCGIGATALYLYNVMQTNALKRRQALTRARANLKQPTRQPVGRLTNLLNIVW